MSPSGSAGTLEGTQPVPSDQDVDNENMTGICATVGCYNEADPTVSDWLRSLLPSRKGVLRYARGVFVFTQWLPRYSYGWIVGDCIAGLTVGFVVIPQAMAYALLATLSPEYGLYTSFMGAALYWLFGTSKDIVIGTTAVGSLLVGSVITSIQEQRPDVYTNEEIAKTTSAIAGMILLFIALLRLGWVIEFIPYIPISAFVTAASIIIIATQFPALMGIPGVNTRQAPYLVIINALKGLPNTHTDAAIGLTSVVLLYAIRFFCARMEKRYPARKKTWGIISSMRLTFVMLLYTLISWLVTRGLSKEQRPFRIVGPISRGFNHAGPPRLDGDLILLILPQLPAMLIILVIEHIAIAKSFGRIFGYTVLPSQEMLAQGASNLLGPFVGGYVCTGSFGASAVLSKAGVRTPLAGLFSAVVLVLALYALTAVFYYIPMAALAGLIIHAVADLPTPPKTLHKYWQMSPFELIIWVVGVVVGIFVGLEVSVYVTIALSLVWLLVRQARTKGSFLGQVHVYRISDRGHLSSSKLEADTDDDNGPGSSRNIYLPLDRRRDATNPSVAVEPPYPGVFIFRFTEGLSYINQAQHMARLITQVRANTRPGRVVVDDNTTPTPTSNNNNNKKQHHADENSDRLWSDPLPSPSALQAQSRLPRLRAVVLDCSAVDQIDITAVQGLVDARNTLDKHACTFGSECVEWHFAGLSNRWARKALARAGFGTRKKTVLGIAHGAPGAGPVTRRRAGTHETEEESEMARLAGWSPTYYVVGEAGGGRTGIAVVEGLNRPFFHVDLTGAVDAAVRDAKAMEGKETSHVGVCHEVGCPSEGMSSAAGPLETV
ncbi:sulfate transporter family-domain-containing protein [Cercophora newfieldiana]|uniref:Sulfate transporter family-domain-containing protein n=1 Tax=Cercophora newfieldiana TaxID=92897 RepID=A0AA39YGK8_9PEZI|nr:sulfate transporter family-domain-containing protein [Cercophora newfieldiana]